MGTSGFWLADLEAFEREGFFLKRRYEKALNNQGFFV
ncbi:hypothetical protein FBY06_11048 [Pseudomonas sp. SJZ085]|nr:hypothetical protein FBX99_110112 [Pseudomonas sp. SJZ074]TWC37873.1 hypothetical protein FBY06_11048 [Pseudomonas sp. SJZ085]